MHHHVFHVLLANFVLMVQSLVRVVVVTIAKEQVQQQPRPMTQYYLKMARALLATSALMAHLNRSHVQNICLHSILELQI